VRGGAEAPQRLVGVVVVHEGDRARAGRARACSPAFVAVPSIVRESTNCGLMRCGLMALSRTLTGMSTSQLAKAEGGRTAGSWTCAGLPRSSLPSVT